MNDKKLIQNIAAGDASAFKSLVDKYQRLVLNTCYNILGRREDAEDVAQDVFLQIYKSAGDFRLESKLSTWIYRISVNRSLNFLRKNKRFRWFKSLNPPSDNDDQKQYDPAAPATERPDVEMEKQEQQAVLQKAILSLPEKQRIAFTLHKYEEISYQEIAEIMECSLSSVESLIHRAKLKIQDKIMAYIMKK